MYTFARAGHSLLLCWCLFVSGVAPAFARQPAAPAAQVAGRTAWDANYLYFSFQIDDPNLAGTNTTPLSQPQEDDSVAVYLHVGQNRPDAPNANTHILIVSAAGGSTFLSGSNNGALAPRPLRDLLGSAETGTLKYAVTLQGTLNRADDRDQRFTVEMAIPWKLIGADPKVGVTMGYNAVVRSRDGGRTSLAPGVTTDAQLLSPARWSTLTLRAALTAPPVEAEGVFAPEREVRNAPVINGVLGAAEWTDGSLYAFAGPEKMPTTPVAVTPTPATPGGTTVPPLRADRPLVGLEPLLMARYVLSYQGDPRKPTLYRGVRASNGRFLLSNQPATGAGPWFSSDRPGWHRQQLAEMRRLGVDVALTITGGPDSETAAADQKALMVLVSALREMTAERIPTPQVALWLDTLSLVPPGTPKPNLETPEGRAVLYGAVKRWMDVVPRELRAVLQLPTGAGGAKAYPIFLSTAAGFSNTGGDWVNDLRRRFAADFGNEATLLVAGGDDFAAGTSSLMAYLPVDAGGKGSGAVSTYTIQPGYDDTAVAQRPAIQPRRDGAAYREAWEAALASKSTWIVLDSWNDFSRGTEVAASRQYGPRYLDLTRIYALQIGGLEGRDVKWLRHNAPSRMRPLQVATVDVVVQNSGSRPLRPTDGVALGYRWFQNGKVVAESPLRVRLESGLFPTQVARFPVGVAAARVDDKGSITPLPPGSYVLRIDMIQTGAAKGTKDAPLKPGWFGDNGDTPLSVPVTITAQIPDAVAFEGTTTPPLMQTGVTYPVSVRLRWLGAESLPADTAALTYQLLPAEGGGTQTIQTGSIPIRAALPAGAWVTLPAPLSLADPGGSAIPTAFPEAGGRSYRLRWLLTRTTSTAAVPGVYEERVAVYPEDFEARIIVGGKPPTQMEANSVSNVEVTIVNRGRTKWARNEMQIGSHWFFPDGVEAQWRGFVKPINREVEPGRSFKISLPVRAPERDGEYVLAFDVTRGADNYLSTLPVTGTGDMGLVFIRVTGGRLTYVDLARVYNVDAVAPESAPGDGDADGKGSALPAEDFPPDAFGLLAPGLPGSKIASAKNPPAYPSGYYADVSPTARLIGFRYGPQENGAKNAVSCDGQVITVPRGRYTGLHVSAASTGGQERPLTLTLTYRDGKTETVTRAVPDWGRPPTGREAVAILTRRRRTPQGDVAAVSALRHSVVPVTVGKDLVSITLPNDPAIKIFAMTLER